MKTCRCGNSDLERARKKAYFLERPTITQVTTIEGLPLFLIQIKIQVNFRKVSPGSLLPFGYQDRKDRQGALVDLSHSDE